MVKHSYALPVALSAAALAAYLGVRAYDRHLLSSVAEEQAPIITQTQQSLMAAQSRKAMRVTEARASEFENMLDNRFKDYVRDAAHKLATSEGYSLLRTAEQWCPPCKLLQKDLARDKSLSMDAVIPNNTLEESLFTKRELARQGIYLGADIPALAIHTPDGIVVYKGYTADGKVENTATGLQVPLRDVLSGKR